MVVIKLVSLLILLNFVKCYNSTSSVQLFPELPLVAPQSLNEQCKEDSAKYEDSIKKLTTWAYQMWDSSAKRPTGQIHGLGHMLGDFDECLAVHGPIKTQYCLATLSVEVPKPNNTQTIGKTEDGPVTDILYYTGDIAKYRRDTLRWALCVPLSCPTSDISESVNKTLEASVLPSVKYKFQLEPGNCQVDRSDDPLTEGEISFITVTLVLCAIALLSTSLDIAKNRDDRLKKPEKMQDKLISIFSMRENTITLMQKERNDATAVFHPMRFILMIILVNGHRFVTQLMGPMSNAVALENINRTLASMLFARGDLLVDSFIVLSGLLTTYAYLSIPAKKQLSFIRAFALRYFRLTPVYAYVIFFMATLFYKSGQGPLWSEYAGFERDNCQANWWVNMLHLNNYVNLQNWCMLQSFYIPLDIHFFILSFPFNYLLRENKKWGLFAIGAGIVVSVIIPFTLTIVYDMPAAILLFNNYLLTFRDNPMVTTMYIKSHNRFGAYMVGMLGGYVYFKLKGTKRFIPGMQAIALSTAGFVFSFCVQLMGHPFFQVEPAHVIYRALYSSLQRPVFAVANIVCLFGLSYGAMPVYPQFLSWAGWAPMARLTYGMYLTNMGFQMWDVASLRQPYHFHPSTWTFQALADTVMSMVFAFVLYLLIEAPFGRLAKELISPKPQKSVPEKSANPDVVDRALPIEITRF